MLTLGIWSCGKDDSDDMHGHDEFEYHAHIHAPNEEDKHMNDTLSIQVQFESHAGMTVHHVNVSISNKSSGEVVYSQPTDAHVHATEGQFVFMDTVVLSESNGFLPHSDWVLTAKVWGHEEGGAEVSGSIEFHVHP